MGFSELLGRSSFSFLRGASSPEEMVETAHALGLSSVALCDHGGLYGSVRAWTRAKELGLTLHVGATLTCAQEGLCIVLLAQSARGYENLCRLISLAHADCPKGEHRLTLEALAGHHEELMLILPSQPDVWQSSLRWDPFCARPQIKDWLSALRQLFGSRGFVAAWRRLDAQDELRDACVEAWVEATGFEVIASAWPLFHEKARKPLADIVCCIREGLQLEKAGKRLAANAEAFLRSEEEMKRVFAECPEWVDRTEQLAEQLKFQFDQLNYQFPCELDAGESADERLSRLAWEGAGRRYAQGVPSLVVAQIKKELQLIRQLKVAPYFLCTWEIVEIARGLRILCQGRGSAANSAVCFVLGITAVDPARSCLLFERFLSAERDEPPDIDIDFEHERREEVIQEIYRRYGRDRAAMVSEVICYRGKSSLREVGKAFGLSLEQVDHLSRSITHWDSAAISEEKLRQYGFDPADRRLQQVVHWAQVLEGAPRHLSIHVGGFVLSKAPLFEVAPIEPASMPGRSVIPWDKDDLEALGFFKVDVLGLGMLTAIRKTLALIFERGGLRAQTGFGRATPGQLVEESFDPLEVVTRVPAEDPGVYAMISEADTVGVFQIESRAQMAMLPRLRPQKFYDLVIEVALVRPGPIQGGMVHPYLKRRNGEQTISVPHPELWPILERTLGVPLFQEQVMQLSIVGAGYSGGEADQLRRDMAAWKKTGRLLRHRERLLNGFAKKGIAQAFGEALFEQIKGFGDYGFPESHAASFALLVYLSAWQKAHYPAHFTCALLNSQPMGFYSPSSLVKDAQRHGVKVRGVNVLYSYYDCTLEQSEDEGNGQKRSKNESSGDERSKNECGEKRSKNESSGLKQSYALRLGLRLIKGLRVQTALNLEAARAERLFKDLEDLVRRAKLRKDEIETLAEAGALEGLVPGRRQALWAARAPRGFGLFEGMGSREQPVALPLLKATEQLVLDYGRVGLSIDDHPMCHLRAELRREGVVRACDLAEVKHESLVKVAGLVLSRQRPGTASGVVFITLEDETGTMNLVLFAQVFERFRLAAKHATLMLVSGKLERQVTPPRPGEVGRATPTLHVIVQEIERLDVPEQRLRHPSRDFH